MKMIPGYGDNADGTEQKYQTQENHSDNLGVSIFLYSDNPGHVLFQRKYRSRRTRRTGRDN
jgi:hypothetical protein